MYILHIDTSGPTALVLLARDGVLISERRNEEERNHAGSINLLVEEVLKGGSISLSDIDAIAVCNGPGSYTGLRIGLATAKGFCYALDKPLILHNRLQLLLLHAQAIHPAQKNFIAVLPARTGEYYAAASGPSIQVAPAHFFASDLSKVISEMYEPIFIGEADEQLLRYSNQPLIPHSAPDANIWIQATTEAYKKQQFAAVAYAEPDYLKAAFTTTPKQASPL